MPNAQRLTPYPAKRDNPMANLLLTMLQAANIPTTHFADTTGPIEQLFAQQVFRSQWHSANDVVLPITTIKSPYFRCSRRRTRSDSSCICTER